MTRIHKFELRPERPCTIRMPRGAKPLYVDVIDDVLFVWAEVDDRAELVDRHFYVYGTGEPIDQPRVGYIGTVVMRYEVLRPLVWHVFGRAV